MIPIALTIIAATWAGLAAERRWPEQAGIGSRKALTGVLYTVLPAVVFLNLNRVEFNHDFAIGIIGGAGNRGRRRAHIQALCGGS